MTERTLQILESADEELSGWSCPSTAGCCHFERTGREPYVTAAEWELIEREVARQGRRWSSLRRDGACPFLSADDRCTIYSARPLGCRTFYCSLASGPSRISRFHSQVRELQALSESLGAEDRGRPLRSWVSYQCRGAPPPRPLAARLAFGSRCARAEGSSKRKLTRGR